MPNALAIKVIIRGHVPLADFSTTKFAAGVKVVEAIKAAVQAAGLKGIEVESRMGNVRDEG